MKAKVSKDPALERMRAKLFPLRAEEPLKEKNSELRERVRVVERREAWRQRHILSTFPIHRFRVFSVSMTGRLVGFKYTPRCLPTKGQQRKLQLRDLLNQVNLAWCAVQGPTSSLMCDGRGVAVEMELDDEGEDWRNLLMSQVESDEDEDPDDVEVEEGEADMPGPSFRRRRRVPKQLLQLSMSSLFDR